MIRKLVVHNNPLYHYEYHVEIEFDTCKVFYKTNATECNVPYESFFLIPKGKAKNFSSQLDFLKSWESIYGIKGVMIDGYYWSVKIINSYEKEIIGRCDKPEGFDDFIRQVESLIGKPLSRNFA